MWLNLLGIIFIIAGFIVELRGLWLRKPNHPSLESAGFKTNLGMTFFPWRYKDFWDNNGHVYDLVGRLMFIAGVLCLLLA